MLLPLLLLLRRYRHDGFGPGLPVRPGQPVRHSASIGSHATLLCGVTVGQRAIVGAGRVITQDAPDL